MAVNDEVCYMLKEVRIFGRNILLCFLSESFPELQDSLQPPLDFFHVPFIFCRHDKHAGHVCPYMDDAVQSSYL